MINRSLALVASLAFGAVSFGSSTISASANEIYSSCPLGATGGQCVNGHYYAPQQRPQFVQPFVVVQPMQPQRYVVYQQAPQQRRFGCGFVCQLVGALLH